MGTTSIAVPIMPPNRMSLDVSAGPFTASFGDARAGTRDFLDRLVQPLSPQSADDVVLVVSELVTNALRHGGGTCAPDAARAVPARLRPLPGAVRPSRRRRGRPAPRRARPRHPPPELSWVSASARRCRTGSSSRSTTGVVGAYLGDTPGDGVAVRREATCPRGDTSTWGGSAAGVRSWHPRIR